MPQVSNSYMLPISRLYRSVTWPRLTFMVGVISPLSIDQGSSVSVTRRILAYDRICVTSVVSGHSPAIARRVLGLDSAQAVLAEHRQRLDDEAERKFERAGYALWSACHTRPDAVALLRYRDPGFLERCQKRGGDSEYWRGKDGRRRAQYLREILERACFRTVPRDWHTYVSIAPVVESDHVAQDLSLAGTFAETWTENIHTLRKDLANRWSPSCENAQLNLAQLRWRVGERIAVYVTDWEIPSKVDEVNLRPSSFLEKVLSAFGNDSLSFDDLCSRIAPRLGLDEVDVLDGFIVHLIKLGVIQVSRPPRSRTLGWMESDVAGHPFDDAQGPSQAAGYLDVYVRCQGSLGPSRVHGLQTGFATIARLATIIELDALAKQPIPDRKREDESGSSSGLLETVCSHLHDAAHGGRLVESTSDRLPTGGLDDIDTDSVPRPTMQSDWPPPQTLPVPMAG